MDTSRTITIQPGLNGPATTANGGVAAGVIAALLDGPTTVRLHQPPPMGVALQVTDEPEDELVARDAAGEPVLTARGSVAPTPAVPDVAAAAVGGLEQRVDHSARSCVVCGPGHPQGLRVFPAPVNGREDVVATWWQPPAWACVDGVLAPELLWGVLDCPGAIAVMAADDEPVFAALAGITGAIHGEVRSDERVLVVGWATGVDGRKRGAATAVVGEDGDVRAISEQLCIAVPPSWATGG